MKDFIIICKALVVIFGMSACMIVACADFEGSFIIAGWAGIITYFFASKWFLNEEDDQ